MRPRSDPPVHRCTLGLEKDTMHDLARVVSVQQLYAVYTYMYTYVGVSGDGMQEFPNESDASASIRST